MQISTEIVIYVLYLHNIRLFSECILGLLEIEAMIKLVLILNIEYVLRAYEV